MKKKFTILIAAVMLLTMINLPEKAVGQTKYKLEQVTSVSAGGKYVFEQNGHVMNNDVSSSALQTTNSYNTTNLSGTETYVWTLESATNGFYMKNVSLSSNAYLNNSSSTNVSLGNKSSIWAFNFQTDNTVRIQNTSNSNRFLGYTSSSSYAYKAYATSNLNSYAHAVIVYKLVEDATPTCTVDATPDGNFGNVQVGQTASKTFTVRTANLTGDLSLSAGNGVFAVTSPQSATIAQNATTTEVTVTFTPAEVTSYDGNLTISGGGITTVNVPLSGSGECIPAAPLVYTTPVQLTLDGDYVEYTLNPTSGANGGAISYEVSDNPDDNGMVEGNVFTAIETGQYVVTATQNPYNNYCETSATITINVVSTDPSCTVAPDMYSFGNVAVGSTANNSFAVTTAHLTGALTLSMSNAAFSVTPNEIAQDATTTNVTITFAPTATGAVAANLLVNGNGFNNEVVSVVDGTGAQVYTVTFDKGSGVCATATMNGIAGTMITLPEATPSATCEAEGWEFAGWSDEDVDETTTAPTILLAAGEEYEITTDETLYAVYKFTEGSNSNTDNVFLSGSYSNGEITWTSTGVVTIKQEQNTGQTAPNPDYVNAPRWYSGNKITITQTTALDSIIVVANTSGYATTLANSTNSTYTNASASVCAWDNTDCTVKITPSSSSNITIVMGGQSRLSSLTAYYSNSSTTYNSNPLCLEKVETPNITLAEGTYTSVQTTTITCETDGATIYYTTNGDEPTTASTQYVANFNISINESMTIKAIAVADGMANSDVASKDYVINLPLTTMNAVFAKATQIGSSTTQDVTVVFNNWVVSAVNGSSAYVTDNAGKGFIIYTSNHGFAVGDKLSGTVSDTPLKLYNGAAEFTNIKKTDISSVTGEQTVAVVTKTISELSGVNTGAIITVNNVRYDGSTYLEDPDDSSVKIKPYNGLGYPASFTEDHNYNVTGMYLQFNTTKELCPRAAADIVEVEYAINGLGAVTNGTIGAQNSSSQNIITAKYGQSVTLTQSAAEGYRFSSWTVMNGETPVAVNNNAFTMPKGDVTVSATFVPTYAIAVNVTPENTGTVTAEPNPAIEGETVTLTIEPETGYALKSIIAYKTGDTETPVTITENTITMPAYGITVAAEFDTEYSVTYNVNGGIGDAHVDKYGAGANVTVASIQDGWEWTAPTGKLFTKWTTNEDGTGTEYQPNDVISNIAANYDLYAQWRDIVYHVSFSVNGEIVSERNVAYNTAIGTLPTDPELAPLSFIGWSSESATGATNVTSSWKPTGEDENVTVYAVFGSMSSTSLTITGATTGIPTSYGSGNWTIDSKTFYQSNILYQNPSQNKVIQFKAPNNNGYIYNKTNFGNIRSVKITYYSSSAAEKLVVYAGDTENPTSATSVSSSGLSNHVETFTISGNHSYICIYNTEGTNQVSEIQINYEAAAPLTVNIIDENTSMSTDIAATTCVVVKNGATLNFTGANQGTASNLIIEDGGQLKVYDNGAKDAVQATVLKNITGYGGNDDVKTGWNFIASPITEEYTPASPMTSNNYDLYRLNPSNTMWENNKDNEGHTNAAAGFNLTNGRGYLYANSEDVTLSFAGAIKPFNKETPTANQVAVKTGWNLIGNPFTFNVYADVPYYAMNAEGTGITANTVATSTAIAPCTSIVIKAGNAGTVNFSETSPVLSTGDHGNIQMVLAHNVNVRGDKRVETIDNAIVSFNEGSQLEKFYFGNPSASIFIPQNGEDYAIAFSDRQGDVPLYFKANETDTYTISFAGDEMSLNGIYLIDILAEEEIDLSVNPSYTFIGSPADRMARFKIVFRNTGGDGTSDIFAYQNGNDIIVSGEGELQIFDVMGRMVSTQRVNGVETVNVKSQGVYIFRLNDKTQKIVVR